MDCLNCFPPRPPSNDVYHSRLRPSQLNNVRDPHIYNARAPHHINRPPTPYPHQEHFTGELLTLRRAYTRTHKRYVSRRTVDDPTLVRQRHFPPNLVETKLGVCDPGTRSVQRRRSSVSSRDQRGARLQEIGARNDSSKPARVRKSVTFQLPSRDPELEKRVEAQNNRIRMREAPVQKPPPLVVNYHYVDDLSRAFSDLQLVSRYKR